MALDKTPSTPEIHAVLQNATLRYSQVWEDYKLLFDGLDLEPADHVVSIGSAGDNALALLARGVASVSSVDLNPAQTALCELKKVAISKVDYAEFVDLLGAGNTERGLRVYQTIKSELSERSLAYWESHQDILQRGILHSGRLELFWNKMREDVFETFVSEDSLYKFIASRDLSEQRINFERFFSGEAFCTAFKEFTDKKNVAKHGRDIAQYKYVDAHDIGGFFFRRFRHVCTEVPIADNFYLHYLFFGRYESLSQGPFYLRPQIYETLVQRIDRFEVVEESLDVFVARGEKPYSKMNLSDLFEYLSIEETDHFLAVLSENMVRGGRIAFWNHLNERGPGSTCKLKLDEHRSLGQELFTRDRTFFYSDFRVLEVI